MQLNASGKTRSIILLVIAEISAMCLWFVSAAVLEDLSAERPISGAFGAALTSSISAGFVVGALAVAVSGIADRLDPRRVFAVASLLAAACNVVLVFDGISDVVIVLCRFLIGFCLAGVYPIGMKIAVGWGKEDRGWLVGLVVGGLTLGTAAPHLLSFLGGADWRVATLLASALGVLSAVLIFFVSLGPHHTRAPAFESRAIMVAWRDVRIRRAFGGYFGHMWELYAMWAWISAALVVSYSTQIDKSDALTLAKLTAFIAIGAGALMCPPAGYIADRIGKARTTIVVMALSGVGAVLTAVVFGGPVWLVFIVVVFWGMFVIPDSAQFSALIADYSPPDIAGSVMTLQTALGFTLTIATVQCVPVAVQYLGWAPTLGVLALGPVFGIWSMSGLLREKIHPQPES